jgi:hypothetical protein
MGLQDQTEWVRLLKDRMALPKIWNKEWVNHLKGALSDKDEV